ncbi:MAG: DUF6136 family protein [Pseudomonadota bacterium]
MAPTYHQLRRLHFRLTLKAWLQGLDKALLAYAGVLPIGFLAVLAVFVLVQAEALKLLVSPESKAAVRIAVVAGWQGATFVLLRALREAVLMPKARVFFATLPVSPASELRSDLLFAIQGYSLLWAPLAWVAFTAQSHQAQLTLASLAAVSLFANLALLRGKALNAAIILALLFVLSSTRAETRQVLAFATSRLAIAALAAFALWLSYLVDFPLPRARRSLRAGGLAYQAALASGLALPFLAHELRSNVAVRLGFIACTLGACLLLASQRAEGVAGTRVLVFVGAAAAVALYPLPALWRNTLLSKLPFLAGQAAFVQRIRLPVYGISILLFGAALAVAWHFDAGESHPATAVTFSTMFAGGVIAARLGWQIASWLMPLLNFVAVLILGGML